MVLSGSTMASPWRRRLCLWQCTISHISLSLSLLPFFLWEVNLDSENRKKGLPCDSKTRLLILDSYTHTRPCPCFLQCVQRTPLDRSPQGSGVSERAGRSRSSPVRVGEHSDAQDANRTGRGINTRTCEKCFSFTFTFPPKMAGEPELIWKWSTQIIFYHFRSLTWFFVDVYGKKIHSVLCPFWCRRVLRENNSVQPWSRTPCIP